MKRKKEKEKRIKNIVFSHLEKYKEAINLDRRFWMTVIFDFAYLITIFGIFLALLAALRILFLPLATALQSITGIFFAIGSSTDITPALEMSLEQSFNTILWFYIKSAILLFGTILLFFFLASLFKAYIWMHLKKQKHTLCYLKKFVIVNMLWQLIWLVVATILFFALPANIVAILLMLELLAYMYFTPFFRALLTEKHTIMQIYKETFIIGVRKLPRFIIPISLMLITVVFGMWFLVIIINLIAPSAFLLLGLLFIFIAVSWVRFYFYLITKHVTEV